MLKVVKNKCWVKVGRLFFGVLNHTWRKRGPIPIKVTDSTNLKSNFNDSNIGREAMLQAP